MSSSPLAHGFVVAGKYVVDRLIGRGGMGAVYVVAHTVTGKQMAMKCLLPELVHHADVVGRFMREARVLGRLAHRHVVDIFDVGRDGDVLFIVMELLAGQPFSKLLVDDALTLEDALLVVTRAMEGVAAAHALGVVHRDLKPDNIFVCRGVTGRLDDPRVLDFGISKLEEPQENKLTQTGIAMGTPYYMALEQLSGQGVDHRVDVYAMGVMLYEVLAGQLPFTGDSVSVVAIRVLTTEPIPLASLRPGLPAGLSAVVMKAMARSRDDRYQSMQALIDALAPFLRDGASLRVPLRELGRAAGAGQTQRGMGFGQDRPPIGTPGGSAELLVTPPIRKARVRPRMLFAAAGLLGLIGVAAAVYHGRNDALTTSDGASRVGVLPVVDPPEVVREAMAKQSAASDAGVVPPSSDAPKSDGSKAANSSSAIKQRGIAANSLRGRVRPAGPDAGVAAPVPKPAPPVNEAPKDNVAGSPTPPDPPAPREQVLDATGRAGSLKRGEF